jgi:hypothetical protein
MGVNNPMLSFLLTSTTKNIIPILGIEEYLPQRVFIRMKKVNAFRMLRTVFGKSSKRIRHDDDGKDDDMVPVKVLNTLDITSKNLLSLQ